MNRTGGQVLIDALRRQSVDRIYCVPGESFLPVLDALHDTPEIGVVGARHEGAAANMAEADGKLTGRPGICFVTRGPGATHASVGVHTARQDSTPMILFIGQVSRGTRDREGFQEIDYVAMFAPMAKWVAQVDVADRIPEYVARAFRVAMAGRAGPVVLVLPEDVLAEQLPALPVADPIHRIGAAPRNEDMEALRERLEQSDRPLMIVGGGGWTEAGCDALRAFSERNDVPWVASFRRQDLLDNRHRNYCGHLGLGVDAALAERVRTADLLLAVGSRLGENTTSGYSLLACPVPDQPLVHVHPEPQEIGRVFQPILPIACGLGEFATAASTLQTSRKTGRTAWLQAMREDYLRFSAPTATPASAADPVDLARVMGWLSTALDDDAIVTNGAGNYTVWLHRFFRYRKRSQLAPTSGAMGYGVSAAIAAKLRYPERQVVAFAGDGCFQMYPQELGTAVQHRANVIILVVNNGSYGTIRMHQERRYPGRVVATELFNPDFVALARSYGAYAEEVSRTDGFEAAFCRATAAARPAVLELRVDPAWLTPSVRLKT